MLALLITLYCLLFLLLVKLAVRDSGIHCLYFYPKPYLEEAQRRAEIVVDVQSDIIDAYNESVLGSVREILCEGFDPQAQMFYGRSYAESPDIDGRVWFTAEEEVPAGTFVSVRLTGTMDGELTGETV